jgi:hypothetical protein
MGYLQENKGICSRGPDVNFLITCFTDQMDSVAVQYLESRGGLLSNC